MYIYVIKTWKIVVVSVYTRHFPYNVNVSGMCPQSHLSFQLLMILALWIKLCGFHPGDSILFPLQGIARPWLKPTTFSSLLLFHFFPSFLFSCPSPPYQQYSALSAACWGYFLIMIYFFTYNSSHLFISSIFL